MIQAVHGYQKRVARDSLGYILTGIDALRSGHSPLKDREPCPLETTIPGILPR